MHLKRKKHAGSFAKVPRVPHGLASIVRRGGEERRGDSPSPSNREKKYISGTANREKMADYVMGEQTGGGEKGKHKRRKGDEGLAKADGGGEVITTNPNAKKLFRILFWKKSALQNLKNHVSEVAHKQETARKLKSILVCPTFFCLQPEKGSRTPRGGMSPLSSFFFRRDSPP